MTTILTSSLGGSYKVNGKRFPTFLLNKNGLTEKIKHFWKNNSKALIISAASEEFEINDSLLFCQREAFEMSGLKAASFEICDCRNESVIEKINEYDVILLAGGNVPMQNRFFKKIRLKQSLADFNGLVIAWSAGSMNSAELVYALPEDEGEGIDQSFERFISGLGITKKMIIPHFQSAKTATVDGLRVIEDIIYPDSIGREFIALNDGSFIISSEGNETLYGEAFLIKDGKQIQICKDGEFVKL